MPRKWENYQTQGWPKNEGEPHDIRLILRKPTSTDTGVRIQIYKNERHVSEFSLSISFIKKALEAVT